MGHEAFEKEVALENFEQQKLDFEFEQEEDFDVEAEGTRCAFTIRVVEGAHRMKWTDEIKPVEGLCSGEWAKSQLDGYAMYITRDNGIIRYVTYQGFKICAKEDSDVKVSLRAYKERTRN